MILCCRGIGSFAAAIVCGRIVRIDWSVAFRASDGDLSTHEIFVVKDFNGTLGFFDATHLHEGETFRLFGALIGDNFCTDDVPEAFEKIMQFLLGDLVVEITDVKTTRTDLDDARFALGAGLAVVAFALLLASGPATTPVTGATTTTTTTAAASTTAIAITVSFATSSAAIAAAAGATIFTVTTTATLALSAAFTILTSAAVAAPGAFALGSVAATIGAATGIATTTISALRGALAVGLGFSRGGLIAHTGPSALGLNGPAGAFVRRLIAFEKSDDFAEQARLLLRRGSRTAGATWAIGIAA